MTAEPEQDERCGLPSASEMHRIMACPGSRALSKGLTTPEKEWTKTGTITHALLAGEIDEEDIEGDASEILIARANCEEKLGRVLVELGFTDEATRITESNSLRLWLHDDAGRPVLSGKYDGVVIEGDQFLVYDFKTGRKDQIPPAANAQLVSYGLLVAEEYGLTNGFLAIIPAWRKTPDVAAIDAEAMETWRNAILDALEEAEKPGAPRNPGPHCDYCAARPICKESWKIVQSFGAVSEPATEADRFDFAKHAQATLKAYLEHLREMLEKDPEAIPGLKLTPGNTVETVKATAEAYDALKGSFTTEQIMEAAGKLSLNSLASLSIGGPARVKALNKAGKEAKAKLKGALGELVSSKQNRPSIERVA
jgi:CRISPR/Cas system-associated exonuclease Cas4 (RecB family)